MEFFRKQQPGNEFSEHRNPETFFYKEELPEDGWKIIESDSEAKFPGEGVEIAVLSDTTDKSKQRILYYDPDKVEFAEIDGSNPERIQKIMRAYGWISIDEELRFVRLKSDESIVWEGEHSEKLEETTSDVRKNYARAKKLEKAGQKAEAARLYGESGYAYRAYQLYEELGDVHSSYALATEKHDWATADLLAFKHGIPDHEYRNYVPIVDAIESIRVTLKSRLCHGATAERELGFNGFQGKIVADIGTRDGRFISMFRELGAKEVALD